MMDTHTTHTTSALIRFFISSTTFTKSKFKNKIVKTFKCDSRALKLWVLLGVSSVGVYRSQVHKAGLDGRGKRYKVEAIVDIAEPLKAPTDILENNGCSCNLCLFVSFSS